MSPPPSAVNAQLRQLIHYHLDNGFTENALFLAGRLHALDVRNADAAHLLALCNLRLGRYKAALECSKSKAAQSQHLGCAYVFAQACLGLGRFELGATALENVRGLWHGRNHWSKRVAMLQSIMWANCDIRQALGDFKTACSRRCSLLLHPRETLGSTWRHQKGNRLLCRCAETQLVHVGCFHRSLRHWRRCPTSKHLHNHPCHARFDITRCNEWPCGANCSITRKL